MQHTRQIWADWSRMIWFSRENPHFRLFSTVPFNIIDLLLWQPPEKQSMKQRNSFINMLY